MALFLTTPATVLPISVADVKKQIRKDDADDDDVIENLLIPAAIERGELATWRQFLSAVWTLKLDGFPCEPWLELPRPPLLSTTLTVTYIDGAGIAQTWDASNYIVDAPTGPRARRGRLAPAYGVSWPTTQARINAVTIVFTAGYGTTAAAVPARLRMAMLQDAATLFAHREDVVKGTNVTPLPRGSSHIYQSFKSYPTQLLPGAAGN